jgi:hypothetical protein
MSRRRHDCGHDPEDRDAKGCRACRREAGREYQRRRREAGLDKPRPRRSEPVVALWMGRYLGKVIRTSPTLVTVVGRYGHEERLPVCEHLRTMPLSAAGDLVPPAWVTELSR